MKKNKLVENKYNEKKGNLRRAKVENSIATIAEKKDYVLVGCGKTIAEEESKSERKRKIAFLCRQAIN